MKTYHKQITITLTLAALFLLLAIRPLTLLAERIEPASRALQTAWQQANDSGAYQFTTEIIQTTRPLPTLTNAGKGSRSERLYIEGGTNIAAETMRLKLWTEGGSAALGQGAIEIQVADGRTLGRVNDGAWQEVDNISNFFAPDSDPLYFLQTAENISQLGTETRAGITFTRYAFDINSDTFARQMRQQMETQLEQDGNPLPSSVQLEIPRQYVNMVGSGELWIGADGLPLRQIIHLQFPEAGQEQVSAEISTDFTEWGTPETAVKFTNPAATLRKIQPQLAEIALQAIPYLFFIALTAVFLLFRHRREAYAFLSIYLILSMLIAPILQGNRVHAFNQTYSQAAADQPQNEAVNTVQHAPAAAPAFNPLQNPLASVPQQVGGSGDDSDPLFFDDGLDEDNDGISNAQETEFYGTDPRNADSDGDTLSDGIEINELGTNPLNADSDGDNIPDWAEVEGFVGPDSRRWYLDPLVGDSGGNGEPDGAACRMIGINSDTLECADTDGDNVPDVYDLDNDGDGVPDTVDSAPVTVLGDPITGLQDQTFQLELDNVTSDEPIYVDFQLRPTNPDHLWYSLSQLDWPENDRLGQVQSVLTTTFKSGEGGDMRLVPMLEIEMNGTPLPLPLTNPQASLTLSGIVTGTAVFTQQAADVQLSLALSDANQYNTAVYNAACADITSSTIPTHDLGSMGDGETAVISSINLPQTIADGSHSLRLTNGGSEATCQPIPNIINGGYADQMIDLAALQVYGVSVREKDAVGGLLVYVPLTLLYEQAGNVPVALTGRMFYQPTEADFGAVEEARLTWAVMTRTDHCLPMPDDFDPDPDTTGDDDESEAERVQAFCSDNANWVDDGVRVVHAYSDDWRLTGLSVQRNLGLKTAVIYEDPTYTAAQPSYDPTAFSDDNLWSLALGLDVSFMAGRDDGGGSRDLTIDDLAPRWDKNSNGGATATDRWELPQDALIVETFNFADSSGLATLAQTHAYAILENQFTTQALGGGIQDPTLLFLQETRLRSVSLDYDELITPIGSNGITLDIADSQLMPEMVVAGMNWVPYQFNGSWQPYDLTQYWIDKGGDMDAALALTPGWTAEDVTGASLIARAYYITVAAGVSQVVEIDGLAAFLPSFIADAEMQTLLTDANPLLGTGKAVKNMVSKSLGAVAKIVGKDVFAGGDVGGIFKSPTLLQDTQKTLIGNRRGAINLGTEEITPASLAKAYGMDSNLLGADSMAVLKRQARWSDGLGYASTVLAAAAAVTGVIAAGVAFVDADAAKIIGIVGNTIAFVAVSLQIASLILKLQVVTALNGLTSFGKVFSHFTKISKLSKGAVYFYLVGQAISIGLFVFTVIASAIEFVSLAFNQLAANLVAGAIVGVLLLALASIPVVGQLLAAIVAVIDLIVTTICSLVSADNDTETGAVARDYLCGGISGLLTKLVSWFIYDQTPLISLDEANRLNVTNFDFELGDPNLGYSNGNQLSLAADVQSALYRNDIEDITDVSPFIIYRWQFSDDNIKATTLTYTMTTSADDLHEPLSLDGINDWLPPTVGGFAEDSNFVINRAVENNGNVTLQTGVNRRHTLWLSEGQAYNVQECILIIVPLAPLPIPTCWLREEKDTQHIDLSELLVFDVFPTTIDEFYQLTAVSNGGFTQAWDNTFPMLQDADGDGLISAAFGGPDPDDSSPDIDDDGLSDFFELQQSGTNPQNADSDGDGLCDNQEVAAGTDPNRADTDSDGLIDSDEVFHQDICDGDGDGDRDEWLGGWEFVYAFNGATPLRTRVIPSPFTVNPDGDAYIDSLERVYGFNPNVPSSGDILNLSSQVDDSIVQPGTIINYTAELENGLRASHALGLLDVEFTAAVTGSTVPPFAFNLQPNSSISTNGQVTIDPAITQSQNMTMTNRAGALIVDPLEAVNGRSLWLRLNDTPTGNPRIFADDSLNNWEVSCAAVDCPVDGITGQKNNGVQFLQNRYLQMPDGLQAIGLTPNGFTVDLWLNPASVSAFNLVESGSISWDINGGNLVLQADGAARADTGVSVVTANGWNHLTWRYDGFTQTNTFFVDGTAVLTQVYDLTTALDSAAADDIYIRGVGVETISGVLDEYAIYPFPLADSTIAAIGYDRVFYAHGETAVSGAFPITIQDDSIFQNDITCQDNPANSASCPSSGTAIVDNGYGFSNSDAFDTMPVWVEPSPNLDLSGNNGNFSITAWVNPIESVGSEGSSFVMGYGNSGASQYLYPTLRVDPDVATDSITILVGIEDEAGTRCDVETTLDGFSGNDTGGWFHTSVVFDGLHFTITINNMPVTIAPDSYRIGNAGTPANDCQGITPRSGTQFYLGGYGDRFDDGVNGPQFRGKPYGGVVDELQILNYALSSEEVADIYWDELPIMDLRLDEPPASDLFEDRSFNNIDATCNLANGNCPFSGLPGRDNQAALFDGVDDALSIANTSQLGMLESSFTLSAWINPRSTASRGGVIGNGSASDAANNLFFGLEFDLPQFRMGAGELLAASSVTLNEWTHLTGRYAYDATTGDGTLSFFIDGVLIGSQANVAPLDTSNVLRLGRNESEYFDGMIDYVQVYREALTDNEIAEVFVQAPYFNLRLDDPFGTTDFAQTSLDALPMTATCSGAACPQADIKGRVYGGVTFDGQDDLITIAGINLLGLNSYSVGLWVMPTQQKNGRQMIISKGSSFSDPLELAIAPDSMQVAFTVCGHASGVSVGALTENVWNHLLLVRDHQKEESRLYINGSLDTAVSGTGIDCASFTPYDIELGNNNSDFPFAGGMDELALYFGVLSDRDVAELYSYQQSWFDTRVGHRITIDADLPSVALNVTAAFLPNQDKVLAVSASDPTSEIVSVEYNINGGGWQMASLDVKVWLFTFDPNGSGDYTIELRATDEAGNVGSSSQVVAVDGAGPVLGALNVEGVTAVSTPFDPIQDRWIVDLSGSVTTVDSPLDSITVNLFDDLGASVSGVLTPTIGGGNWQLNYPLPVQSNGVYTVSVQATDLVGNLTERNVLANIDGTAPAVNIDVSSTIEFVIDSNSTVGGVITETGDVVAGIQAVDMGYHPLGLNDRSGAEAMTGVVVHLPLNEAGDPSIPVIITQFDDMSGNGRFATCTNCPDSGLDGMLGYAADFDGANDRLQVADLGSAIDGSAVSFGAWIYANALGGSGDGTLLALDNMSLQLRYDGGTPRLAFGTVEATPLNWDEWTYVMVTIADDDSSVLYINGTAATTFTTANRPNGNSFLQIGDGFDGLIDDVVLFDRALSADEAAALHRGFYPVFRLPFDDVAVGDGLLLDEASRFAHAATWQDGGTQISRPVAGAVGNGALTFDGAATQINVSSHPALELSDGAFTQLAWVYPQNSGGPIIDSVTNAAGLNGAYPFMNVVNGRQLQIGFGDGSGFDSYTSGDLLTLNAWNFVAVTFDGTTYNIYVDGVLRDSTAQFAGTAPAATSQFNIGIRDDGSGAVYFDGMLDEIAIYRQVLTAERIASLLWQGWHSTTLDASGAGVQRANWSADVPTGLSGSYQIRLQTSDLNQNLSLDYNEVGRWSGLLNAPPTANDDLYSLLQDGVLDEPAPGVLANDTDMDSVALTAVLDSDVAHGALTLTANGGFVYTPNAGYCGTDSFTYHANDGSDDSNIATVTIDIICTGNLTVMVDGTGSGVVTSDPPAVDCDENCSVTLVLGTTITLTATADAGFFAGWEGACSGTGDCVILLDAAKEVTATFSLYTTFLPIVMNNYASAPDLVVEDIMVTGGTISVRIANMGDQPVTDEFWVDMYLNPTTVPTAVNQTWQIVGTSGLVWGVTANALPLNPGESLTLTVGDAYYRAAESSWSGVIGAGTAVYVQVDSANAGVSYGAVQENHEIIGTAYNNISGPVTATSTLFAPSDNETATYYFSSTLPER